MGRCCAPPCAAGSGWSKRRRPSGCSAATSSASSCARCWPMRCTARSRAPTRWRRSAMPPSALTGMPLAPLTTLRLGGPAAKVVDACSDDELVDAVRACDEAGERVLVLAGGSNVVIADEGFDGTVVRVLTRGVVRDGTQLDVAAGEPWDEVVAAAVAQDLVGIECLSGIPGSTGATPIQ